MRNEFQHKDTTKWMKRRKEESTLLTSKIAKWFLMFQLGEDGK